MPAKTDSLGHAVWRVFSKSNPKPLDTGLDAYQPLLAGCCNWPCISGGPGPKPTAWSRTRWRIHRGRQGRTQADA
jgi:hypothetical protein